MPEMCDFYEKAFAKGGSGQFKVKGFDFLSAIKAYFDFRMSW